MKIKINKEEEIRVIGYTLSRYSYNMEKKKILTEYNSIYDLSDFLVNLAMVI